QLDELVAAPRLHLEIIDMKVVAFRRQRYQSHRLLRLDYPFPCLAAPSHPDPASRRKPESILPPLSQLKNGSRLSPGRRMGARNLAPIGSLIAVALQSANASKTCASALFWSPSADNGTTTGVRIPA